MVGLPEIPRCRHCIVSGNAAGRLPCARKNTLSDVIEPAWSVAMLADSRTSISRYDDCEQETVGNHIPSVHADEARRTRQ
jgi:hypothetical protein